MKKAILLFLMVISNLQAQIVITPNPFGINSGTITFTYGSAGDYSIFNPQSDPNLYLYTGLETDGVANTWDYHDNWTDVGTMIPLTWNATANAYLATFNIATRSYINESTQVTGQIPSGTTVNNWFFIIRNAAGTSQSADIQGTNYGFTPGTFLNNEAFENNSGIKIFNNFIHSDLQSDSKVDFYAITGQRLASLTLKSNQTLEIPMQQKGMYLAIIESENSSKIIKFAL